MLYQSEFIDIKNWLEVFLYTNSNRVQILIDVLRYRFDLGVQFIFNLEHVSLVVLSNEVDGNTKMTKSSRTPNPVKIGVWRAREIEVDDHIDRFNVNTSSEEIRAHQASRFSIAEVMVDPK